MLCLSNRVASAVNPRIVRLNVVEYSGFHLNFPQMCADIFSCLPDRFIDDICSNDFLMDSFFRIPEGVANPRSCLVVSVTVERLVAFARWWSGSSRLPPMLCTPIFECVWMSLLTCYCAKLRCPATSTPSAT